MENGKIEKKSLIVVSIDLKNEMFSAIPAGRKKETLFSLKNVLTCSYVRGDHGELE